MKQRILKIATRKSPLALWQAEFVKSELEKHHPSLQVELLPMVTDGDVLLDSPLSKIGGKGLFVKQLEVAILEGKADLAVHSIKDIPAQFPEGLMLSTICPRDEIRDAFISNHYDSLADLPKGAIVGTSSLRRQAQIQQHFPDLIVKSLRGNVGTRLSKLDSGEYDGIILAAVGLKRLGLESRIKQYIDTDIMIPAVGQGAVGIETREEDRELQKLLAPLDDVNTRIQVLAERAMNRILNGGCQVPIACLSEIVDSNLKLKGWVGSLSSTQSVTVELSGSINEPTLLGEEVGKKLLSLGADKILKEILA